MILSDREIKILEKFCENKEISIRDLAIEFNVSERMIRYNIEKINLLLKFINMDQISKSKKGYFVFSNSNDVPKLLSMIKKYNPINKYERLLNIETLIAFNKSSVNINYLADYFKVSRITINNDLKELSNKLVDKRIYISNNKGLFLKGEEKDIFLYKISILSEVIKNEKNILLSNEIMSEDIISNIKEIVNKLINTLNLKINNKEYYILLAKVIYIYIYEDYYSQENIEIDSSQIKDSKEFKELKKIISKSSLEFQESKLIVITNILLWLKAFDNYEKYHKDLVNIEILSKDIIKKVQDKIDIQINKDKELEIFLTQHLKSMIYRIKNGYRLIENFLDEKEKQKDEMYYIVKDATNILSKVFKEEIKEDEIHLLKIHFLASIERIKKQQLKPTPIIVITNLGPGSKKMIHNNLNTKFLVNIAYIGTYYNFNKNFQKYKDVKYILTTSHLKNKIIENKKVIKINAVINEEDVEKLIEEGLKINDKKITLTKLLNIIDKNTKILNKTKLINEIIKNFPNDVLNDLEERESQEEILKSSNILFDQNIESIEKAIKLALVNLEKEYTKPSYTNEVLNIFKTKQFQILRYNGVIIPHTKNKNNVIKSGISIVCLKNPVIIENTDEKIDIIVTFAIKNEKNISDIISNTISKVFKKEFREILKSKDKNRVISYLKE